MFQGFLNDLEGISGWIWRERIFLPKVPIQETHSTSVHLHTQTQDVSFHLLAQDALLPLVAYLKHLLHYIVAEYIRHQLISVWQDLFEDLLSFLWATSLKLLLNKAWPMLIAAEFDYGTENLLWVEVSVLAR
jgi:hypothetical protein